MLGVTVGLTPVARIVCAGHDCVTWNVPKDSLFSDVLPGLPHPVGTQPQEPQLGC